jgi:hypothetical protein
MSQDVGKFRCQIAQVSLYMYFLWVCMEWMKLRVYVVAYHGVVCTVFPTDVIMSLTVVHPDSKMLEKLGFYLNRITINHNFLLDVTGCRKIQVSDCTSFTVYVFYISAVSSKWECYWSDTNKFDRYTGETWSKEKADSTYIHMHIKFLNLLYIRTRNVCITKYARLYKLSNGIMVIQSNN